MDVERRPVGLLLALAMLIPAIAIAQYAPDAGVAPPAPDAGVVPSAPDAAFAPSAPDAGFDPSPLDVGFESVPDAAQPADAGTDDAAAFAQAGVDVEVRSPDVSLDIGLEPTANAAVAPVAPDTPRFAESTARTRIDVSHKTRLPSPEELARDGKVDQGMTNAEAKRHVRDGLLRMEIVDGAIREQIQQARRAADEGTEELEAIRGMLELSDMTAQIRRAVEQLNTLEAPLRLLDAREEAELLRQMRANLVAMQEALDLFQRAQTPSAIQAALKQADEAATSFSTGFKRVGGVVDVSEESGEVAEPVTRR